MHRPAVNLAIAASLCGAARPAPVAPEPDPNSHALSKLCTFETLEEECMILGRPLPARPPALDPDSLDYKVISDVVLLDPCLPPGRRPNSILSALVVAPDTFVVLAGVVYAPEAGHGHLLLIRKTAPGIYEIFCRSFWIS
jgi:hypothetical protein